MVAGGEAGRLEGRTYDVYELAVLPGGYGGQVFSLAGSKDGREMLCGLWDSGIQRLRKEAGRRLLVGGQDGTLVLWDAERQAVA